MHDTVTDIKGVAECTSVELARHVSQSTEKLQTLGLRKTMSIEIHSQALPRRLVIVVIIVITVANLIEAVANLINAV